MAAQQQRQGGMSSNPLSQSTPGTPVSGYVPAYVPMVPSGTPSHIRTQSLPASINMTILQASLPDPATLGPFIPQRQYSPHTSSDRRRYVEEVSLDAPISFNLRGANNAVQEGIPLKDALTSKFMRLVGRDDPMFVGRGPSISVRLMVSFGPTCLLRTELTFARSVSTVGGLSAMVQTDSDQRFPFSARTNHPFKAGEKRRQVR
jgi:hypothetical protein